jgi:hypothetical protein
MSSFDWRPVALRARDEMRALVAVASPANLAEYRMAEINAAAEVELARKHLGSIPVAVVRFIPPESVGAQTLPTFFDRWVPGGRDDEQVLIFDHFEEILTVAPNDLEAKRAFFDQVGALLRHPSRYAIFALRDEYVGALEPYRRQIPRALETRFRLDLLGAQASREAIVGPSRASGVPITEEAATILVDDLRAARVRRGGQVVEEPGPYVEPVQLQVVCYRLWERHRAAGRIDAAQVRGETGDVDVALGEFYADRIAKISDELHVPERTLRDWCERRLITSQGTRNQVQAGDGADQGLPEPAILALIDARIVRAEERRGITWYELAHDRLIEPIHKDNASWREQHLHLLQRRAALWLENDRLKDLLLRDQDLVEAEDWASANPAVISQHDRQFLVACQDARRQAELQQRRREAELLAAISRMHRGLSYSQQGKIGQGMLYMARSLEAIPARDTDLERAIRMQLSAWRSQLHELGERLAHRDSIWAVAFSPDGKAILTSSDDGTARLWDAATGRPIGEPLRHNDRVRTVAFSRDGRAVLTGSYDGTARLWDAATGRPVGTPLQHEGPVRAVAFSPDGKTVLTGSEDATARLWDAATGRPIGEPLRHPARIWAVAFSPDGKAVLTGSNDCTAALWDAATGEERVTFEGHDDAVWAVAFDPDGKTVLTGSFDKTARLWDAATARRIGEPLGHGSPIWAVAFSPDGKAVLTGSEDRTARLWDAATGEARSTLEHQGAVRAVAFGPGGKAILTGSVDGTARLWDAATGRPVGPPHAAWGPGLDRGLQPRRQGRPDRH